MRRSTNPQPALGTAIRELRTEQGMTQEAVAHEAGVTASTYGLIERGQSNPTWATVDDIASTLEVSLGDLAKRADRLKR